MIHLLTFLTNGIFLVSFLIAVKDLDEEELKELTENAVELSDDLDFKDDGYIELVLRVLGLMCDNQKKGLQVCNCCL